MKPATHTLLFLVLFMWALIYFAPNLLINNEATITFGSKATEKATGQLSHDLFTRQPVLTTQTHVMIFTSGQIQLIELNEGVSIHWKNIMLIGPLLLLLLVLAISNALKVFKVRN
jgi:hypothetical protein